MQRNLYVPLLRKVNEVVEPAATVVSFDQLPRYAVTVWVVSTARQMTRVPAVIVTECGCQR